MDMEQREKLAFLKQALTIKEGFGLKEHGRKKELMLLRSKLTTENAGMRDKIAEKRHRERIELMNLR